MFIVQIDTSVMVLTRQINVLNVILSLNKIVPSFCYHPSLALEGNCRMCLVEVYKLPKPVASCCLPIQNNMKVFTNTPMVYKARENALEFLLLNHPLDCPICDQGGECDLQDQTFLYSAKRSRFMLKKHSVMNKYYNVFIKTIMNRCITCTKCVRLVDILTGKSSLGALNRGSSTEIGPYISNFFDFEFSGTLIDICPVGALTAKPYSFQNRPLELVNRYSLDLFDGFGLPIRVETNLSIITRILPKSNLLLNDRWINNRIRFCMGSINAHSFIRPSYIYKNKKFLFYWSSMLRLLKSLMLCFSKNIVFSFSDSLDLYSLYLLKQYSKKFNSSISSLDNGNSLKTFSKMFLFNNFDSIKHSKFCLIFGLNTRLEISNLNLKLLKESQKKNVSFFLFGTPSNLFFNFSHFGFNLKKILFFSQGRSIMVEKLKYVFNLMILFNTRLFGRFDGQAIYFLLSRSLRLKFNLTTYNSLLHTVQVDANKVGSLLFGFSSNTLLFLKNKQTLFTSLQDIPQTLVESRTPLVIDQTLMDTSVSFLHLPISTSFEFSGQYINTDGFLQRTFPCLIKKGETKSNFIILKNLMQQFCFNCSAQTNFFNLINKKSNIVSNCNFDDFILESTFKYNIILTSMITSYIENFYSNSLFKNSKLFLQYSKDLHCSQFNFL